MNTDIYIYICRLIERPKKITQSMVYFFIWTGTYTFQCFCCCLLQDSLNVKEIFEFSALYTFAKLTICTLECGELIIRSKIIFNWLNPKGNMHKLIIDNICELYPSVSMCIHGEMSCSDSGHCA